MFFSFLEDVGRGSVFRSWCGWWRVHVSSNAFYESWRWAFFFSKGRSVRDRRIVPKTRLFSLLALPFSCVQLGPCVVGFFVFFFFFLRIGEVLTRSDYRKKQNERIKNESRTKEQPSLIGQIAGTGRRNSDSADSPFCFFGFFKSKTISISSKCGVNKQRQAEHRVTGSQAHGRWGSAWGCHGACPPSRNQLNEYFTRDTIETLRYTYFWRKWFLNDGAAP